MGKKEKKAFALSENFETVTAVVPKLEALLKAHKEIAAEYQKYRKNGGPEIPGIEKHLGIIEKESKPIEKAKKTEKPIIVDAPEVTVEPKKAKKK